MKNDNTLIIESGAINKVAQTLIKNDISGKILYVSDPIVDNLYGEVVKSQLETIGKVKIELV